MIRTELVFALVAACLGVGLTACGDDGAARADGADATPSPAASSSPTVEPAALCEALLTDSVMSELGWVDAGPAGEHVGRCERGVEAGLVTVGLRPDLFSGGDPERAERAYDEACVALRRDGSPAPDTDTDWLDPATTACFRPFPAGKNTGLAEMFVLTDDAAIVEVQVAAGAPTPEHRVVEALTALVPRIEDTW